MRISIVGSGYVGLVSGVEDQHSEDLLREMYAPFNRNHEKMIFMDVRSSELTKYSANAMLATKISLMNELANIAERTTTTIFRWNDWTDNLVNRFLSLERHPKYFE